MENKNGLMLFCVMFLIVSIFVGWIVCSNMQNNNQVMMHQMPNGQMMGNVGMDMDNMMKGMLAGLDGKTGDAFDKEFIQEMIVHHQGAVAMAERVLEVSKRPELLQLANDIISAQTKEIEMMRGWQLEWFRS